MKKLTIGLSVLCMCAILSVPVTASFANHSEMKEAQVTNVTEDKDIIPAKEATVAKEEVVVPEEKVLSATKEEEVTVPEETVAPVETGMTREQALAIAKTIDSEVALMYMGDENTYECIKENGMAGYVFLPDREGDMAYFIDKNTGSAYLFHPSGYFELL